MSSHLEQNCCTQRRLGTCAFAVSEPLIFGGIKIIKYVQYLYRVRRQNVLEMSYTAQMSNHSVLFTRLTILFSTVRRHASRDRFSSRATSIALKNAFLITGVLLMFRETRLARSQLSISLGTGDSDGGESTRRPSHKSLRLVTAMCGVSTACFVTCFTCVLLAIAPGIFTIR